MCGHPAVVDVFSSADSPSAVWKQSVHILNSQLNSFITVFFRTFNPADYAEPAQTEENYGGGSTWNNTGSMEMEEGASKLIY